MSDKYDVIVVGAGPGGATSAAMLTKAGFKVLLLDKNSQPGGKTMTVSKNGFRYEYWPICVGPAAGGIFQSVIKDLGLEKEAQIWLPDYLAKAFYKNSAGKVNEIVLPGQKGLDNPEKMLNDLLAWAEVGEKDLPEVLRLMGDLLGTNPHDLAALDDVPLKDWLARYKIPMGVYTFLATIRCEATMEVPVDSGSTSEFLKICARTAIGGGGLYFVGGLGRYSEALVDWCKAKGAAVHLKTKVEQITVQDGRVTGVVTDKGTFHAPVVISTAGIHPTVLKLVGEKHFDASYVNYIKDLVPDWSFFGARYFLDKPVLEYPVYLYCSDKTILTLDDLKKEESGWFPDDFYCYMGTNSFVPGMAPPGKQFAWIGGTCPCDPKMKMKPLWDALEKKVAELWPWVTPHIVEKEYFGPAHIANLVRDEVMPGQGGDCFGLAQIVGQCGKNKPSPKSPIRGLYYGGFDAGCEGLGMHAAVESGVNTAEMVRQYIKSHHMW
jgi:phytoene dehydrogenase-like protein